MEWHDECLEELVKSVQKRQQRFEAALRFMQIKMEIGNGKALIGDAVSEAIQLADLLLAELEEGN